MRTFDRIYVIVVLIAVLPISALARTKPVVHLTFKPVQGFILKGSLPSCTIPFSIWQEPDPYFTDLKKTTAKGSIKFERNGQSVETFPEEVRVHFTYERFPALMNSCTTSAPPFDPNKNQIQSSMAG